MKSILPILLAFLVSSCATVEGRRLVAGQSSLRDVEAVMGQSAEKRAGPAGETVHWYPRLPWGYASYAARIAPDGRLIAFEQRLTEDNIAKIVRGQTTANDVRDLLGPPWEPVNVKRMERDIWTYPMRTSSPTPKWFIVQLSTDNIVREVYLTDDPQFIPPDSVPSR